MKPEGIEDQIVERGKEFFASIQGQNVSLFNKGRWTGKVMDWCMRNEGFKTQLFRFVDAFPSLNSAESLARHIKEYFGADGQSVPSVLKWGAKASGAGGRIGTHLLNKAIRFNIEDMAKQFIVGQRTKEAVRKIGKLRGQGFLCVVDVLGEATVNEEEAREYVDTYMDLLDALDSAQSKWPSLPHEANEGPKAMGAPRVNISVKPTALYSQARPSDFENSVENILRRLKKIARKTVEVGGFLCIDMESYRYKDITIELFKRLRTDPEFRDYPWLGIVMQAYLRDTDRDLEDLLAWARAEQLPFSIRLVKGAYWDYETVLAKQNGWEIPVYTRKPETDAAFERHARMILENHETCHFACASHNIRSISMVMETARALGVPEDRYEFQVLYGMAEPVRKGLLEVAGKVRLYAPYGKLVPGMAYLVRRLLENTSNESFLRQSFAEDHELEALLENPLNQISEEIPHLAPHGFENEPTVDFTVAAQREMFPKAIAEVRGQLGKTYPLFINGQEIFTEDTLPSLNPANPDETLGLVCQAGLEETGQAVEAALAAFPKWRDTPFEERAHYLRRSAEIARRRLFELSAWQVLEVGKQWDQAHADLTEAIDFLDFYADEMIRLGKPRRLGSVPGEVNHYLYEPKGVVAVISPWNFPLAIGCGMVAGAIVTGNCVVFKPSGVSSIVGHHLVEIFKEAGLPDGVFNYNPGRGRVMGDYLVEHAGISAIAFTGSVEIGLRIIEKAAKVQPGQVHVKKVIAEMGGKNAIIVDDDADLDEAVPQVLYSAFGFQGQKCSACSRVIVLDSVYERFVDRLLKAAASMKVGPSEHPENIMGPVVDANAQKSILEYIEIGRNEGHLLFQSETPDDKGYYVPMTIIGDITPEHRIAQEEIFGPVLALMRARDFDQAIDWANSTRFGLTGGIFSRSPEHLDRARREFRVGNLYLNRNNTGALVNRQPFGGAYMSGLGTKAGGPDYLLHFMDPRTITENTMRRGFAPAEEGDSEI